LSRLENHNSSGVIAKGEITLIRPLGEFDLERVRQWINSDNETAYYLGIDTPLTRQRQKIWYHDLIRSQDKKVFAILHKDENVHIGNISIDSISRRDGNARLTIFIGEKSQRGQGMGKDALTSFLHYCFTTLKLHRIYLIVHSNNRRALKLYKRIGFRQEGLLREHECYDGVYVDKIFMGILKKEFEAL